MAAHETEQAEALAFLARGEAYGAPQEPVERLETHAAFVFLVGERAYKMKRAVRYSFLDFSTLSGRRAVLEAELRLNRRTAPQLYRRVLPLARGPDGALALDGPGEPVEWLLEMARFDQAAILERVAASGGLDDALVGRLAAQIVRFHEAAEVRRDHGGHAGLSRVIDGNEEDLEALAGGVLAQGAARDLSRASRAALARHRDLLERRREGCRVRHCHGDLHLGNIVLLEGEPVLFDCLEFDEDLACIDTLYDLAFLLMDLWHRGLRPAAQHLLGCTLELDPDDEGLAILPLFLSCRAAIRAKVQGFAARNAPDAAEAARDAEAAGAYLTLARSLLEPPPPRLIAIGGLSGTGKSTLARALAPEVGAAPGAVVLRSDRLRKRLFGVAPTERLGPAAYSEAASSRVYRTIAARARVLLSAGHSVIADAVFADPAHRRQIVAAARAAGAPFFGVWLHAAPAVLERRIAARRHDASDATVEVLRRQLELDLTGIDWPPLEVSGEPDDVLRRARLLLA